eukprot:2247391-Pleurochrysis_carterae.AAC.1
MTAHACERDSDWENSVFECRLVLGCLGAHAHVCAHACVRETVWAHTEMPTGYIRKRLLGTYGNAYW